MRRVVTMIIAVGILFACVGAVWWTHHKANDLAQERNELARKLNAATIQEEMAGKTRARIEELEETFDRIDARVEWEPDPTNVLRWFAEAAETVGVRLTHSQVLTLRSGEDLVGDNKLRRTRYTVSVQGSYSGLVRYLDRVERSPYLTVVEEFSMSARRNAQDEGELLLTVSALRPAVLTGRHPGQTGEKTGGENDE